jgi:hypothetical protein
LRIPALALLAALATTAVHAQTTLTAASANVNLDANGLQLTLPGGAIYTGAYSASYPGLSPYIFLPQNFSYTYTATYTSGPAIANISGGNLSGADPSVTSSLFFAGPLKNQSFETISEVSYEFAVDGPANQTVSVDIASIGQASVSAIAADSFAYAELEVSQAGTELLSDTACAGGDATGPCASTPTTLSDSFSIDPTITVQTDTPTIVTLFSEDYLYANPSAIPSGFYLAYGSEFPGFTLTESSSVDPTITLDTTDPAYSLDFSPGLGVPTPSPTPEPSTLMLASTGLAGAFSLARRRFLRG